jgi:hypothetical protein
MVATDPRVVLGVVEEVSQAAAAELMDLISAMAGWMR